MLRRLALTAAAIGSAGVAHALTLQRSETHDLSSAAMHYMTFMVS